MVRGFPLAAAMLALLLATTTPAAAQCDLPERWMGWQVSLYNAPHCEAEAAGVAISGEGAPAGVYLTRRFDLPQNLHLRVSGAGRLNQVNLRIRINSGEPVWHDAPVGEQSFAFEDITELELLVYADVAFEYTLIAATLESEGDKALSGAASPAGLQHALPTHAPAGLLESARPYGDGVLKESEGRYTVAAPKGPGGVFFTYRVEGPTTIALTGAPLKGRGNLRLQQGAAGELRYSGLAAGEAAFYVDRAGPVELLVYADEPFEFSIAGISATPCEGCGADADLLDLLEREIPGIGRLVRDDPLAGARELLDWAAVNGDWTEDAAIERETYPLVAANPAGYAYFEIFAKDRGAVFCGGLAVFLNKLLHLYGYDSFVVDFGDPRGYLTHLTTVVSLPDESGERRFYIFDPWLNTTFRRRAGDYYPVYAMIDDLEARGALDLVLDSRSLADRDWHIPKQPSGPLWHDCEVQTGARNGVRLCKVPGFTVESFLAGVADSWRSVDVEAEIEGLFRLFQRRIFSASYPSDPNSLSLFLDRARARGIPVGYPE